MHKLESVAQNETHKNLGYFEMQTENLIPARGPSLVLIIKKKRTCHLVNLTVLEDHWVKTKQSENRDKYWDLARELKKLTMEHESDGDTDCRWNGSQKLGKKTGGTQSKSKLPSNNTVETS